MAIQARYRDVGIDARHDTGVARRDEHLRSPDYLDVKRYNITFTARRVKPSPRAISLVGALRSGTSRARRRSTSEIRATTRGLGPRAVLGDGCL
jgi:hypothetical protein